MMTRRAFVALSAAGLAAPSRVARAEAALPYGIQVYGNFERMMRHGHFAGRVALDAVAGPNVYAVGALAGLEGEVTGDGGRLLVSYGRSPDGRAIAAPPGAQAALLVTGVVARWEDARIESDLPSLAALEAALVAAARRRGLDTGQPFPFLLRGELTGYSWHVLAGAGAHGEGGAHGHAARSVHRGDRMAARLVGFYSGPALEGAITHSGERIHVHVLDVGRTQTGHLDAAAVPEGAVLSLPAA